METRSVSRESLEWYEKMMKAAVWWLTEEQKITRLEKQLYIALGFLLETAALLEVDTCPMEWFEPEKYTEILWLEKLWVVPVLACPVGYRSDEDSLANAEKVRFSKDEVIIRI